MDVISEFFVEYDGLQAFRTTIYLTLLSAFFAPASTSHVAASDATRRHRVRTPSVKR